MCKMALAVWDRRYKSLIVKKKYSQSHAHGTKPTGAENLVLKARILCIRYISATVREILDTVEALENRHVITLTRVDHDEFITLL